MAASEKPQPSAGATLSICASLPTAETSTAYALLTWIEVGEITNIGEFSRTYNLIAVNSLSQRRTRNLKGSYTEGAPAIGLNYAPGDDGQDALLDALESDDEVSFRIQLNDGTTFYNQGLVTGVPISLGGVDELVAATANLTFNGNMVRVYPT